MTFVQRTWRIALALGVLLTASVAATVLASPLDVSIVDKTFQPATITVNAGDTVTWTVTKSIGEPHSVTSGKPGPDQGKDFDSGIGLKDEGQSFPFTFDTPGTYDYFCQVHPTVMTGQVVVLAAGQSAPAASAPAASEAPAASAGPEASPAGSPGGSPAATEPPVPAEAGEPIPPANRYIGAGILAATLVLLFAANWYWRRLNPPT
jgi:plastocyanin